MPITPKPVAPPVPRITVAQALALPVLRRALPDVLAGRDHLDRPIRWVHAGEVAYIASMLTGGELLLTTGMGIGRRASDQRRFIAALAEKGLAALAIELGPTFAALPDPLVQAAEQHGLPLIALNREVAFISVTEAIHTEIVNAHYALLRRGDDVHQQLTQLLLDGHGIPEVLRATCEMLGNPIFLEDGDGRLLFHAGKAGDGVDPLDAWKAVGSEGGRAPWRAGLAAPVPMGANQHPGRLLALPVSGPLDEIAEVVLQRAAAIVALSLLRARQEEELVARERGNFLADLAEGRIAGSDAERQAGSIGFSSQAAQVLPIAAESGAVAGSAAWSLVLRDAQADLESRGLAALVGQRDRAGRLLAVVALRDSDQRQTVANAAARAIRVAAERRLGASDVLIAVGAGVRWRDAGPALKLAAETAASAAALPPADWHDVRSLELQRLLWHWRDDAELAGFVQRRLGALIAHDAQRKHHLLPTLEALCANGWRKAETARALHLNRQALYNRLTRIEELLEVDLSNPEQTMTLHLALRAMPYVDGQR
ncbi:PucR family transcriptional regulator [Patulibacter defluvii]|uniref:PucR family transcriptional regulator n=1 Tax=Patulibacter defluvii TaxID=3095358 RepID=UPI002A74D6AA|nr:PucR family transcriptional regulator [Patulibacter sp. DM4]